MRALPAGGGRKRKKGGGKKKTSNQLLASFPPIRALEIRHKPPIDQERGKKGKKKKKKKKRERRRLHLVRLLPGRLSRWPRASGGERRKGK